MADIHRYPLVRHVRGTPTMHLRQQKRGELVREGVGLAFWFRPLTAVLSELPIDDRELPLLFHARTRDFQEISVQASLTYRIADPGLAATRLDFSIDPDSGRWRASPLDQLASLLSELAQQYTYELIARSELHVALTAGPSAVRDRIEAGLVDDARLRSLGIEMIAVRVVAVRAEPEVEKALQTPTREQVQQEADRATYERRALAVERERAIAENELQNQIELATREEQLVAQRGQNERRRAEEAAVAARIDATGSAERERIQAAARADSVRLVGESEAAAETAKLTAYQAIDSSVLLGIAAREFAESLPRIGSLTITPDLISGALAKLSSGSDGDSAASARAKARPGKNA
jgi:regulator of protease activity HflC (stomatin/prohibitin superfamily)